MSGLFTRLQYYDCWQEPQRGLKANINCSEAAGLGSNPAIAVILLWEKVVSATTARRCYHRSHCGRARLRTPAALHIRALVQHSWTICCSEALLERSEAVHECSEAVVRANRPSQGRVDTSCLVLHSIYTQTTANILTASMNTLIIC